MTDHPLRSATDHCLGEPLPHQLANRARAPPTASLRTLSPAAEATGISCGISPPFGGLSPFGGQVTHVLRTRAPCACLLYCYSRLRTRLACVKHAASVRSEPGSNSRLNWMFRRQKSPANIAGTSSSERTFYVARFNSRQSNGFWHVSFSCQRTSFLSGRKATADSAILTSQEELSRRNERSLEKKAVGKEKPRLRRDGALRNAHQMLGGIAAGNPCSSGPILC